MPATVAAAGAVVLPRSCSGAAMTTSTAAGKWANLKGAHFEGALLGSSDVQRICENPTLDKSTKKAELGCK